MAVLLTPVAQAAAYVRIAAASIGFFDYVMT